MKKLLIKKIFIKGIPRAQSATRGDVGGLKRWSEAVIQQTQGLIKITEPCEMRVLFMLRTNSFPADYPHGPDLDNLLKRFQDALNKTIFENMPGTDSCVIKLFAAKEKAQSDAETGAFLEIYKV